MFGSQRSNSLAHWQNPRKTRLIAEAKIRTERLDARILADLLRADLLSASYIPPKRSARKEASSVNESA